MKILADWDVSPCRLLNPYRRFGISHSLHSIHFIPAFLEFTVTMGTLRCSGTFVCVYPSVRLQIPEDLNFYEHSCKAPYTFPGKLSDFTVWRHTWWKNWVNCPVLTGNSAGFRAVLSSRLSHREMRSSLRESHSFLSLPADTTMASSQCTSFLVIHSADERRMIYSFSNTTAYSTFYAFFSSFRITLWSMWLANSKRQPCFYPP